MIQVCGLRTTASCSRGFDVALVRLSIQRYAAIAAQIARPAYTNPAVCRWIPASDACDQPEDPGAADEHRQQQLDDRDARVAAGRVQAERGALAVGRVEEVDVRHRAGEVAAAEAGGRRDQAEHPVRRARVLHRDREQQRRDQQQPGADHRPVAAAELRHRERVRQPQQRADQVRQRDQQEQLLRA